MPNVKVFRAFPYTIMEKFKVDRPIVNRQTDEQTIRHTQILVLYSSSC